jgi:hypothetical protein
MQPLVASKTVEVGREYWSIDVAWLAIVFLSSATGGGPVFPLGC